MTCEAESGDVLIDEGNPVVFALMPATEIRVRKSPTAFCKERCIEAQSTYIDHYLNTV
jgi:hypothetical protein